MPGVESLVSRVVCRVPRYVGFHVISFWPRVQDGVLRQAFEVWPSNAGVCVGRVTFHETERWTSVLRPDSSQDRAFWPNPALQRVRGHQAEALRLLEV